MKKVAKITKDIQIMHSGKIIKNVPIRLINGYEENYEFEVLFVLESIMDRNGWNEIDFTYRQPKRRKKM